LTDTQQVTGINGGLQIFNYMASLLVRHSLSGEIGTLPLYLPRLTETDTLTR